MIIGKKVLQYKEIDSTNEEGRRLIRDGEGEGLVIIADTQSEGRGKPGSRWFSPKGNLYFTAIIKPRKNPKELSPITILAALAARSAIKRIAKLSAIIKWPNDLVICGKKVGGILVERVSSGHLIIGIGININVFSKGINATSLKAETKKKFSVKRFGDILIQELDKVYLEYLEKV